MDRVEARVDPVVTWALNTRQEYLALPKDSSDQERRARLMLENRLAAVLTGNVPLRGVLGTWRSHQIHSGGEGTFYQTVVGMLPKVTKDNWKKISPANLGQYFSLLGHDDLFQEEAGAILQSYVNAPSQKNDCADMYYNLALAAVRVSHDPMAFEIAVRLGTFATPALIFDSSVFRQLYRVRQGFGVGSEDEQAFKKLLIAKQAFMLMDDFIRPAGQPSFIAREGAYIQTHLPMLYAPVNQDISWMQRRLTRRAAQERMRLMQAFNSPNRPSDQWPVTLENDPDDPLNQLFNKNLADRVIGKLLFGNDPNLLTTVPTPDSKILYVIGNQVLRPRMGSVIRFALNVPPSSEFSRDTSTLKPREVEIMRTDANFEGYPLILMHRRASAPESALHPLQILDFTGFPTPRIIDEDGKRTVEEFAQTVQREQMRFINPRGIRIPLNRYPELRRHGLTAVDFRRNPDDPNVLGSSIMVGDAAYDFALNRYFRIDLEGRPLLNYENLNKLSYVVLQLLYPVLCVETQEKREVEGPELGIEVVSRMGHLRWLEPGKRFRQRAVRLCWQYEGKDLHLLNFERMERNNTSRESTYVRSVISEDPSLPPQVIRAAIPLAFQ